MGSSESAYQKEVREMVEGVPGCVPASFLNRQLPPEISGMKIDVGIDPYLLSYSGTNSNAALNQYSSQVVTEMGNMLPVFVEKVGSVMAGVSSVPNAVGIGAFCIAMILRICFSATKDSKAPNTGDLLRNVFAEEKSIEVRVQMNEYMKRYSMHLSNDSALIAETNRREIELSLQLTRLRDTLLTEGQMNDAALKRWTNGAAFHAQMLIHLARLKKKTGSTGEFENAKTASRNAINIYNDDLNALLEKYKPYKGNKLAKSFNHVFLEYVTSCCIANICCDKYCDPRQEQDLIPTEFMEYVFSGNDQIIKLKKYFPDLLTNLDILAGQQANFKRPGLQ